MVIKLALAYVTKPAAPSKSSEDPGPDGVFRGHPSNGSLEEYLLDQLAEADLAGIEEHLLVCDQCRAMLERIEPINYIHYTEDGPVYERITMLTTGAVMARHSGRDLHAGRVFRSFSGAKRYLSESFSQMFPDHICTGLCASPPVRLAEPDSRDRILRDLAETEPGFVPPA
ncbi:MAG TPA: zf-HC2 domain-containing protein [Bryobacteraceae bacterium]|nr:zf-HC2 domain-containing protein [Bryobacteraceae bacterium]